MELKEKFAAISDSITIEDKAAAETIMSRPTIDKYLSGDITKIETAEKLLGFLNKRIQKRIRKVQKAEL